MKNYYLTVEITETNKWVREGYDDKAEALRNAKLLKSAGLIKWYRLVEKTGERFNKATQQTHCTYEVIEQCGDVI